MAQSIGQACSLRKLVQARQRSVVVDAGGNRGYKAVLLQRKIGNQVVQLKDDAHLVTEKTQQVAAAIDLHAVTVTRPLSGASRAPNKWSSVLLPQPDGRREQLFRPRRLPGSRPQNRYRSFVIALPHILCAEEDAALAARFFLGKAHSKRSASTARMHMA